MSARSTRRRDLERPWKEAPGALTKESFSHFMWFASLVSQRAVVKDQDESSKLEYCRFISGERKAVPRKGLSKSTLSSSLTSSTRLMGDTLKTLPLLTSHVTYSDAGRLSFV
jgi:hypothetical protein